MKKDLETLATEYRAALAAYEIAKINLDQAHALYMRCQEEIKDVRIKRDDAESLLINAYLKEVVK